jgi:hypothetical protein
MANEAFECFSHSSRICLDIGTKLRVEIQGVHMTLESNLVGMEEGQYLIIRTPSPLSAIKNKLFIGNDMIVKYLYKGSVFAFQTRLMEILTKPVKLLFLEYPKLVESHEIRAHKRINCFIPSNVNFGKEEKQAVIGDISNGGGSCIFKIIKNEKVPSIRLNSHISLTCQFPGMEDPVLLHGEIKNIKKNLEEVKIGFVFTERNVEETKNIISQYVFSLSDFIT